MDRRRTLVTALLVLIGLSVLYGVSADRDQTSVDVVSASTGSWRIATTGTPWLDDVDLAQAGVVEEDTPQERVRIFVGEAPNGHVAAFRSPGAIAVGVPAYAIADLVGVEGYSLVPQAITAALLTAVAMTLLLLALLRTHDRRTAVLATLAVAVATPVWTVAANATWTHTITLLGLGGMLYAVRREWWWLAGLAGGVAIWGRAHTAVIVAVVGLGLAWAHRSPRVALGLGVPSAALLGLASLWSHWVYGTWSPTGGYFGHAEGIVTGGLRDDPLVNLAGFFVSPDRGLLVWTPVLLVLLPSLVRTWRRQPAENRWFLVAGLLYLLVQNQANVFHGGDAFWGYRLTLETMLCAVPAYVVAAASAGRRTKRLLVAVVGLQGAAVAMGAVFGVRGLEQSEVWTDNAVLRAVTEVPALVVWFAAGVAVAVAVARASGPPRVPQESGAALSASADPPGPPRP